MSDCCLRCWDRWVSREEAIETKGGAGPNRVRWVLAEEEEAEGKKCQSWTDARKEGGSWERKGGWEDRRLGLLGLGVREVKGLKVSE